jgi:hypothetical protein
MVILTNISVYFHLIALIDPARTEKRVHLPWVAALAPLGMRRA